MKWSISIAGIVELLCGERVVILYSAAEEPALLWALTRTSYVVPACNSLSVYDFCTCWTRQVISVRAITHCRPTFIRRPKSYLNVVWNQRPQFLHVLFVLELEKRYRTAAVLPRVQMKDNPRNVHGDELVSAARRVRWFWTFGHGLDDLTRRAHTNPVVRRQVDLVIRSAPEIRQQKTVDLVRDFDLLPLAELAFVMQNVSPDRSSAVVAAFPLQIDRVASGTRGVEEWRSRWNCVQNIHHNQFTINRIIV